MDPNLHSHNLINSANMQKLIKQRADQKMEADQENEDQLQIFTIKECLQDLLLSIASKLLSSEHLTLDQLSLEEQQMWN